MIVDIKKIFEEEMDLIREEEPQMRLCDRVPIAQNRVVDKLAFYVARIADYRLQSHIEAVNKAHYE